MLVEMLCEERGFFLEIADLIRGLDFTILKGVMEARNDKIWARFAVENQEPAVDFETVVNVKQQHEVNIGACESSLACYYR
ncbi:transcription factor LHW-like isoform X1 [Lotus japonicus]|uniref:transcription factor LHW-like isoform X1 n=1 Tax=Lotus japonicus TaxID=34305 RepID=UPI0025869E02|nr:transcription factor LHW-like isoform X1 [Lotus japonicus]XP_057440279.1 transcription factor LHW-like isoform X1 [Lotus japonicus]XP_057440280.1 transcription factor LHW-like isoform X1 [Lotus japonicus]